MSAAVSQVFAPTSSEAAKYRAILERRINEGAQSAKRVIDVIHSQAPRDQIASTRAIAFATTDKGVTVALGDDVYQPSDYALGQIATRAGIPTAYVRELATGAQDWQRELAADPEHAMQDFIDMVGNMGIDWMLNMCADACDVEAYGYTGGFNAMGQCVTEAEARAWESLGKRIRVLAQAAADLYQARNIEAEAREIDAAVGAPCERCKGEGSVEEGGQPVRICPDCNGEGVRKP